jgi:hypothetical protein
MGLLTKILNNRERPLFIDTGNSTIRAGDLRSFKIAKVSFTNGAADAVAFAWQNPETNKILVVRVVVDVTTAATLAATLNIGKSNDAVTDASDIMAAFPINAIAVKDHLTVAAAIGKGGVHKLDENGGTTDYITGTIKAQNSATTVANIYIEYIEI